MKKTIKLIHIIVLSAILIQAGLFLPMNAHSNDYKIIYFQAKEFYDKGNYDQCIELCETIVNSQDHFKNADGLKYLIAIYELKANCLHRRGKTDDARDVIESLLRKADAFLPEDEQARMRLKVGHLYKAQGRVSKALSAYERVKAEYMDIFPDRYSRYAAEYIQEIMSNQVAEISGKVDIKDAHDYSTLKVETFNGSHYSETIPDKDGVFSLPLFFSTPGTMVSLYVYGSGYLPEFINLAFTGDESITTDRVHLEPVPHDGNGVVAGVQYTTVSGGKVRRHQGISGFVSDGFCIERLTSEPKTAGPDLESIIYIEPEEDGVYKISLPPGSYLMENEHFSLDKGEIKIVNIPRGQILVD